jgi:hypothetical protein
MELKRKWSLVINSIDTFQKAFLFLKNKFLKIKNIILICLQAKNTNDQHNSNYCPNQTIIKVMRVRLGSHLA